MATKEERILFGIQVLWERGWTVTPENVKKMCANGSHFLISLEEAEQVIQRIQPGQREAWIARFTPISGYTHNDWAKLYDGWLKEPEWKA